MMKKKRIGALFLSAVLIMTQLPAVAMAENNVPEDGSIASFEELPSGVAEQTVPVGTELSGLTLPDTVMATVYHVTEDTVIPDKVNGGEADREGGLGREDDMEDESGDASTATPSDADESISGNNAGDSSNMDSGETVTVVTTFTGKISVNWDSDPVYDGDTAGIYVFTADVGGYTLADGAKLPQITVTVSADTAENPTENPNEKPTGKPLPCAKTEGCTLEDGHEGECVLAPPANDALVKTITDWTFVDDENLNEGELPLTSVNADNQADFDTVVKMLPTQISAEIKGTENPEILDITRWNCDEYKQDGDNNWPLTGEYTFTAALPDGYVCDPLPTVEVLLGGAELFTDQAFDGLTVKTTNGTEATQETDGQIKLGSGTYEISGEWNGTLDGVAWNNKKAVITVSNGLTATVKFSDLTINVGSTEGACAFAVEAGGTANITLSGTNALTSGDYRAGLEVPEDAAVTIDGDGSLEANGGYDGAGIGGGYDGAGGTITINGGTVNASGGSGGAGIGGGSYGAGGTITINGGTVNANGGSRGAGIGGGDGGAGGTITINGGTVNASGGENSAGIGGGGRGGSGDITIGGRAEVSAVGGSSSTPLNGSPVSNGTIRIGGDAVVDATGGSGGGSIVGGAGIGGGGIIGGAGIGGGAEDDGGTRNNGRVEISGHAVVNASGGNGGAGIGGSFSGSGGIIIINGGTVNASGGYDGAGIGGGSSGDGGDVDISGQDTKVTASGGNKGSDVGSGDGNSNGGSLSVTDKATLEMKNVGTNVTAPEYKSCTIIDKDGNKTKYGSTGVPIASPTLTLAVSPAGSVTLPDKVTLTATLLGAVPDVSGKEIKFTGGGTTVTITTDSSGKAVYTPANLASGTYKFGASFEGDLDNDPVSATEIAGYTVNPRTQAALTLNGLGSAYTYGCEAFSLSTSGGSGIGAVSYTSSDSSVASVTGDTVTILKAGTFTITATKDGDSSYAEATVTSPEVTASEATPNVNLSATGGSTTSDPITLTATVLKVGTGATPTGTVTFTESAGTLDATVDLDSSGKASYTISNPGADSHTYTAEYSGQSGYYKGASTNRTISVGLTDQTGFAISDPGAKTYGDNDFTLAATGGQSGGSVSFSAPQNNGVLAVEASGNVKIIGAGTVTVTANKDGDSTYNQATDTREITVAPRDIAHVTVDVTGDRVYTGSQLQPVFEVKDGTLAITTGDYTNSYGLNEGAGTDAGSITLTGQRNYTGTKMVLFDIEKHSLSRAVITLDSSSYTHTGGEIKPAVTKVEVDGITVLPTEYDVGYANNINEGTATATITAKADSNFIGSASTTYSITGNNHSSGSSDGSGSSSSSTGDRTYDAKKGWVSAQTGIITGTGSGYSKWLQDETGWKLQYADGTMAAGVSVTADDGRTYERLTWELINGAWYAFGADGYIKSGLIFDPDLGGIFYIDINTGMKTGWQMIDGKWYYFNPISDGKRGIMFTDAWIDGWYVDRDGIWNGEAKKD